KPKLFLFITFLALAVAAFILIAAPLRTASLTGKNIRPPLSERVVASYMRLPMRFEENRGQVDSRAKFVAHGPGYALFLTSNEAVLTLRKEQESEESRPRRLTQLIRDDNASRATNSPNVVHLQLAGSSQSPAIEGVDELPGRSNYFT